jgi:hypothetical protein
VRALSGAQQEIAELRALFAMQSQRMTEATARWHAEDPDARSLILPDLGDLLRWLMDDADRARSGLRFIGRCGNEPEPDGVPVCMAELYARPADIQVRCPKCGAQQGVFAPGRSGDPQRTDSNPQPRQGR